MHIPTSATKPDLASQPQIRLLLVGIPKSGKTYSVATTFPGVVVADIDNGYTAADLRKLQLPTLNFYDPEWVKKHYNGKSAANAFTDFLLQDATKMTREQTLVIDGLSSLADAVRDHLDKITPKGKDGNPDGFWFWKQWSIWFQQFCVRLTTLKCHVVLIAHEQEIRDSETGRVLSYKWLLQGQEFSHRLSQFFTDVFRQTCTATETVKPGPVTEVTKKYEWQIAPDTKFPYCCTRMASNAKFVPATFKSFNY